MLTIEDELSELESYGGWSHRFFLVDESNHSLHRIAKTKMEKCDLSTIKNISANQKYLVLSVICRTSSRAPSILTEVCTRHIHLDENKCFDDLDLLTSETSPLHIKMVMKEIFKNADYAYLSSRMAMHSSLVRKIKMSNIDNLLSNSLKDSKPKTLHERIVESNQIIRGKSELELSLDHLRQFHELALRELDMGLNIDMELFNEVSRTLDLASIQK